MRLHDIVEQADRIATYPTGVHVRGYLADIQVRDAVERCLQRITEAVVQIGDDETERLGLGVAWGEMRGFGNRLRHDYRRFDDRLAFRTVERDLPSLRAAAALALDSDG